MPLCSHHPQHRCLVAVVAGPGVGAVVTIFQPVAGSTSESSIKDEVNPWSGARRVVLAYSGGVDTSVCIPYLRQEWGVEEVIAFAADLGQGRRVGTHPPKGPPRRSQPSFGGESGGAVGEGVCLAGHSRQRALSGALSSLHSPGAPLDCPPSGEGGPHIGGADGVAHGCTGKGNDQVRFDLTIAALAPDLTILTPAREWGMSREDTIAYGERHGIPAPVSKRSPYSIDLNLLGRSIEAGPLEDPWAGAPCRDL